MLPFSYSQATHETAFIKNPSASLHTHSRTRLNTPLSRSPPPLPPVCPSLIYRWLMTGIEERTSCEGVNAWTPPSLPAPLLYDFKLPYNSSPPLFFFFSPLLSLQTKLRLIGTQLLRWGILRDTKREREAGTDGRRSTRVTQNEINLKSTRVIGF